MKETTVTPEFIYICRKTREEHVFTRTLLGGMVRELDKKPFSQRMIPKFYEVVPLSEYRLTQIYGEFRQCTKCEEEKRPFEFYEGKDGRVNYTCRGCVSKTSHAKRLANARRWA